MARRAPRSESSSYLVISVIGVAVVLAVVGGVFITATRKPFVPYSKRVGREPEKSIADDLDEVELADPTVVPANLPPEQRVYQLLNNARRLVCVKDLQKALSMCDEALKTSPAHAADVYFSIAVCHKNHAADNKLPYAEQVRHSKISVQNYERALEAYGQPGARTTFPETPVKRASRTRTIIKWEKSAQESWQRRLDAGVLAPPTR